MDSPPPGRRYATNDTRWWMWVLYYLGILRLLRRLHLIPQPDDAMVGRKVTVTARHRGLPAEGATGEIAGYEGATYCVRFPGYPELWTRLPAPGLIVHDPSDPAAP